MPLDQAQHKHMNDYLQAEERLSNLLGWTEWSHPVYQEYPIARRKNGAYYEVPQWARNDGGALTLMVDHNIELSYKTRYPEKLGGPKRQPYQCIEARFAADDRAPPQLLCEVAVPDHRDKKTAVRFAIVQAVIAKLEHALEQKAKAERTDAPSMGI